MTVYIYNGEGASRTNASILQFQFSAALYPFQIPVKTLTSLDLNAPNAKWQKEGSLLVFGGGEFTKVKEKLSSYGREAIKDFAAGKKYLGICKGGYAGAAQIHFLGQDGEKQSDGFGFFNGVARGSLTIAPSPYNGMSDSATIAEFRHKPTGLNFPALYWGGPHFVSADSMDENVETLVTHQTETGNKIMGIKVKMGDGGQAILLGYHPEAKPLHLQKWVLEFSQNRNDIERIRTTLIGYPTSAFDIGFACLLDDAGIVPNYSFLEQKQKTLIP